MSNEINKLQNDIENLFKQNVNDLYSIKELYRKLKEVEEKITQIKYIDSTIANKLKKEYEKLKKIILDENAQAKLADEIETINEKLSNEIETINVNLSNEIETTNENLCNDIETINTKLDTITRYNTFEKIIQDMSNGNLIKGVAFGDSLTFGITRGSNQSTIPYPLSLETTLREYYNNNNIKIINKGKPGYTTTQLIDDTIINDVLAQNPDFIIFMAGTNNALKGYDVSIWLNDIKTLIKKIGNIPLFIMTIPPLFSYTSSLNPNNYVLQEKVNILNKMIKKQEIENKIKVIDLNKYIDNDYKENGYIPLIIQSDGVHFINDYYKRISNFIFLDGFCSSDIRVKPNQYIPGVSDKVKINFTTRNIYKANANIEKFILISNAVKNHYMYFYAEEELRVYCHLVSNDSSKAGKIILDDKEILVNPTFSITGNSEPTYHNMKQYLGVVKPGLHCVKIITDNETDEIFTNGFSFKSLEEEILKNEQILTSDNTKTFLNYKKIIELDNINGITYKIHANINKYAGIGFGMTSALNNDKIENMPFLCMLNWYKSGGYYQFYTNKMSGLQGFYGDVESLLKIKDTTINAHDESKDIIIKLECNGTSIKIYVDDNLIFDNELYIGQLHISLITYKQTGVSSISKISKIETIE